MTSQPEPQAEPSQTESLQAHVLPIDPQDLMAEAGRKALLNDFIKTLSHEAGSRVGEDPEEVHDMRVSVRRMRSTLRLLGAYYKPKSIDPYLSEMRKIAETLGAVRDLDVMIAELQAYQEKLDETGKADLQPALDQMDKDRSKARKELIRLLDKGAYRRFVKDFSAFLTKPGKGALAVDSDDIHPYQVRHLLPELLYQHLAAVRAYDNAIADADAVTLHALRIEFKRLRYAVTIFSDVLGSGINDFISELKSIQEHLGKIADIRAAKDRLKTVADELDKDKQAQTVAALQQYVDHLDEELKTLKEGFGEVWKHFNTKTVQRQLSNAVANL
ncbi:MAG: CHAD domain-containing protein [Chloroflexota bacterium]